MAEKKQLLIAGLVSPAVLQTKHHFQVDPDGQARALHGQPRLCLAPWASPPPLPLPVLHHFIDQLIIYCLCNILKEQQRNLPLFVTFCQHQAYPDPCGDQYPPLAPKVILSMTPCQVLFSMRLWGQANVFRHNYTLLGDAKSPICR